MKISRGVLVCLSLFCGVTAMRAQSISASIYGRVLDSSNAAVPGAAVRATHLDTGTVYQFTTDALGNYDFPQIRLGPYRLEAEMKGFQTTVQDVSSWN